MKRLAPALLAAAFLLFGQDTKYPPQGQQLPGPPSKADTAEWLAEVQHWRAERRLRSRT